MVQLRPFSGLRFNPRFLPDLSSVVCPPYDVISPEEQAQLYARHPHNIVRLELGMESPGDDERENRYTRAARTLAEWRKAGILALDRSRCLYLHLERFTHEGTRRVRRDLICSVRLAEWAEGEVRPHERTMERPKADRLRLMEATATAVSPVFALYPGRSAPLERAWQRVERLGAEQSFVDGEGREHSLWAVADPPLLDAIARDFQQRHLYIADGHHRYETALNYRNLRRSAGGEDPEAAHEFALMLLTSGGDAGLVILPTHRLLRLTGGLDERALEARLSTTLCREKVPLDGSGDDDAACAVLERVSRAPARHAMALYGPDPSYFTLLSVPHEQGLQGVPPGFSPVWRELDVALLHGLVIQPLLGPTRPEEALDYTRDAARAVRAVRNGDAQLALFLRPTPIQQIMAVADAGERMPEKSTYFYPKPPTGLVLYPLEVGG